MNSNKKLAAALAEFASDVYDRLEALEDFANDLIDPVNPTGGIADLLREENAELADRIHRAVKALNNLRGVHRPILSDVIDILSGNAGKVVASEYLRTMV
jgi:hypothetical protein